MPVLKAELNTSAVDDLINQVVQYKTKVEQMGNKLESRLAEIGVIEIQNNLSAISDVDGNAVGVVGIEKQADKTVVYNKGEQMAYLEYGTGIEGKNNSHPKANKASWQYDTGRVIHTTKSGTRVWHYFDKLKYVLCKPVFSANLFCDIPFKVLYFLTLKANTLIISHPFYDFTKMNTISQHIIRLSLILFMLLYFKKTNSSQHEMEHTRKLISLKIQR